MPSGFRGLQTELTCMAFPWDGTRKTEKEETGW
ncbi:unnamed protein product [Linum tenue]|uniref:Ribulose-1,5-bisphosphate carboxylase/oxygenase large subunit n=1 Tax=Linum tenue TaxID=586396 RepID=A0AAV0M7H5_9ROSI|nr:unnamed protein product [Linum tenue]